MALFGTDGVRGVANVDLTAELAVDLAIAAAHVLGEIGAFAGHRPKAIVAQDSRASGDFLEAAVVAGLTSAGVDVYFTNKVHQQSVSEPFRTVGAEGTYDVFARIDGGGTSGQAGALRLGVARALNEIDSDANRPTLKKAGFLTRDARVIERKKYGLKKARKRSQYSKR